MSRKVQTKSELAAAENILAKYKDPGANLISVLQDLQEAYGYLAKDVLLFVSDKTGIPASQLTGVATFYAQFRLTPPGKYQILVCMGTACHVNNSERVADSVRNYLGVQAGKTTDDGLFSWEEVACLGCCSLSPAMMINGRAYGKLDGDKVVKILEDIRKADGGEA